MDTKEFEILHQTSVFYNVLTSMTECFLITYVLLLNWHI